MTREDMFKVVRTPPSVNQWDNQQQWMMERIGTFTHLIGYFHQLAQEDRVDDLLWLLEQWGITQKWG